MYTCLSKQPPCRTGEASPVRGRFTGKGWGRLIRLVACDLDGTMFGPDFTLDAQAPRLVERLREKGIGFTFASGRAEWFIEPLARQLGLTLPYVACNGAVIIQQGRALLRKQFPVAAAAPVARLAKQLGHSVVYTINGAERVTDMTPWLVQDAHKTGQKYTAQPFTTEELGTLQTEKVMVYDPYRSGTMREIEQVCLREVPQVKCVRYGERSVEITEGSCNKANGLKALLAHLEIAPEEVLVVADDQNDVEILRLAGIGAAVANATPDAMAAADYICGAPRYAGVVEAVERFCLDPAQEGTVDA